MGFETVISRKTYSSEERQKTIRLIEFLLELTRLRSKVVREVDDYEQVVWIADVPHEKDCYARAWGQEDEHQSEVWLEVKIRKEPERPKVPAQCQIWVDESILRNNDDLPELHAEVTRQMPNPDWFEGSDRAETISINEPLEDHPEIQQAWDRYLDQQWLPWMEEHDKWKTIQKVYSALFTIHQEQLKSGEDYELVLGLGLLTWQTPNGQRVQRHALVANATLEFETRLGRFTIRPHEDGAKLRLEMDMLDIEEQPVRMEEAIKTALAVADDDPWEKSCIEGVLQSLVHSIDPQGVYDDSLVRQSKGDLKRPIIQYAPALILRKRSTRGLADTLNRIKDRIEKGGEIPDEFADLAEIRPYDGSVVSNGSSEDSKEFDGEVYFPKPANDEQRRIVDKLRKSSGVLVQGPPGTGKSHTIANLICHLLAKGQRTLITAKTPRALQVLEKLLPEELRPLCINLLGNGPFERHALDSSVNGILLKSDQWNEDGAQIKRKELENHLNKIREEKAQVDRHLRDIRESETHTQSIADGSYRGTAARIAEAVSRDHEKLQWFTDSVPPDKAFPITGDDLLKLLTVLRQFTPEKRQELSMSLPDALPLPARFAELVGNEAQAVIDEQNAAHGADSRLVGLLLRNTPSDLEEVIGALTTILDRIRLLHAKTDPWIIKAVQDILCGNTSIWHERFRVTQNAISSIGSRIDTADKTRIDIAESTDILALYEDARFLGEHVKNGGKLGMGVLRPKVVRDRLYVIKTVRLGGHFCASGEQFSKLADVLHVRIECEKAWGYWKGLVEESKGPYALQLSLLKHLRDVLGNVVALDGDIARCREVIKRCHDMSEPVWVDERLVTEMAASCRLALVRIRRMPITEELRGIEESVSRITAREGAHPLSQDILFAIRDREKGEYERCADKIKRLLEERHRLVKVDEYLSKLRQLLPNCTRDLLQTCHDSIWEDRLRNMKQAWNWARARYWVNDYIRKDNSPALAKRAKQIEEEINHTVAKLAALNAWSYCFSRLTKGHSDHMRGWQQAMVRVGKGTGKHAPKHRREAQKHLNECREAVPAWVMPLHRVWDTVDPAPGLFDVIIVDEASQCGLEALSLFYLGKKILIVGDDKQISPEAGFLEKDDVFKLMDKYLEDFQHKDSFHRDASLFDHGKRRYGTRRITLREHFRCMPEIIRFSNDLCYSDTPLIPLRQYGPDRLPPLQHVYVSGGYREGSNSSVINRPEAEAIVEKIVEMCRDDRYEGRSMGVVVLQGEAQAVLIEKMLLEKLGAEEMESRQLICGNPYSFQGDERDIMFMSLVAANNERIGTLGKETDERRFNVAASRARDMMILFHSVKREDMSVHCFRRKLLDFFEDAVPRQIAGIDRDELERRAAQDDRQIVKPPKPFDSWFEVDVALELLRKNYRVVPQYEFAGKRIDLVVEYGSAQLAIECDGDHWHGIDQYDDDMQRQRQLERCRWEFFRVRESVFRASKEHALERLWDLLEERGILPDSNHMVLHDEIKNSVDIPLKAMEKPVTDEEEDEKVYNLLNGDIIPSGRRPDEITGEEIQKAILQVLSECPNNSCTYKSLAARVLKEVGVLTRGKPYEEFTKRTERVAALLENKGRVETYKSKNWRLRLPRQDS